MGKEINCCSTWAEIICMSMDKNHLHSYLFSINNRILKYLKNNERYKPQGFRKIKNWMRPSFPWKISNNLDGLFQSSSQFILIYVTLENNAEILLQVFLVLGYRSGSQIWSLNQSQKHHLKAVRNDNSKGPPQTY